MPTLAAELKLPAVIGDNMVLQRGRTTPIWGWAEPGATVSVTLGGCAATSSVADDGRWQVMLPALAAQAEPSEMIVCASSGRDRVVRNVLVGDVWLATGPSNIRWSVCRCDNAEAEISTADFPRIRFFTVAQKTADKLQDDCRGLWSVCSPQSVGDVSGVAYFFARRLHRDLDVPTACSKASGVAHGSRHGLAARPSKRSLHSNPYGSSGPRHRLSSTRRSTRPNTAAG